MRLIARVAELYVLAPLQGLFGQMDPTRRDAAVIDAGLAKLEEGMTYLESVMGEGGYAAGDKFTTADCEVTPVLFMVNAVLSGLGRLEVLASHPKLTRLHEHRQARPRAGQGDGRDERGAESVPALTPNSAHPREGGDPAEISCSDCELNFRSLENAASRPSGSPPSRG